MLITPIYLKEETAFHFPRKNKFEFNRSEELILQKIEFVNKQLTAKLAWVFEQMHLLKLSKGRFNELHFYSEPYYCTLQENGV